MLNLLESRVLTNWSFWVLEKTPILFDLPLISHDMLIFGKDLLGICSQGRCEAILQVSLDLDVVCSRFAV